MKDMPLLTKIGMVGALCALLFSASGCGVLRESQKPSLQAQINATPALTPEEAQMVLDETTKDIVYGEGLGEVAVNVGGSVLFPPYAVYVLGNALLSASGYEGIYFTDALPAEEREQWHATYSKIVAVPGRVAAEANGEEFRDAKTVQKNIETLYGLRDAKGKLQEGYRACIKARDARLMNAKCREYLKQKSITYDHPTTR
jgi:hypothetical protein